MINLFTESEVDQLAAAALQVLETEGALYQSDVILEALEKEGARVDRATQRARLPRPLLEEIIDVQRRRQRAERRTRRRPAGERSLPGVYLHLAQFWFDHEHGKRVPGNRRDLIRLTQFGDALGSEQVDQVLLMQEEPPEVEPLEGLLVLMQHSSRPGITYPHFAGQFPYLEEIGQIWCGDPEAYMVGGVFMVSPLRMDRRACEVLIERKRRGLPCGTSTEPVSGISAPVTRAGAIVVGAADILAGWAAIHALDPEATMYGNIESGVVDMPTGNVHFGGPEPLLQDLGCVELFRRRFGGRVGVAGPGDYTSGKFPGYQAAFERLFDSAMIEAYTDHRPEIGSGLLDSGKMWSPLQLLIDRECESLTQRFEEGVRVTADEIALDVIRSVGSGIGHSYLDTEHTLSHYRRSLWFSRLLDRAVWQGDEAERNTDSRLLQRAEAQFNEVMARYTKPEVDEDKIARVKAVVARARTDMLG